MKLSTPRLAHRLRMNALLRRADARQVGPILRYERIDQEPSARPVARLCVALVLAIGLLTVLVNLKQEPVTPTQQCFKQLDSYYQAGK